jgi:hypothetical protein
MGGARCRPLIRFHGGSHRKDVCSRFLAEFEKLQVAWSGLLNESYFFLKDCSDKSASTIRFMAELTGLGLM